MVAATEQPVELVGDPVTVILAVPKSTEGVLREAVDSPEQHRIYLLVGDLEAERDLGVVYGVYLNYPRDSPTADWRQYQVGVLAPFGIGASRDPDVVHEGDSGHGHAFDITSQVAELRVSDQWDPTAISVTFELITPVPAPGHEAEADAILAEQKEFAQATPLRVGRVSIFAH
jgi:hypothetical protein